MTTMPTPSVDFSALLPKGHIDRVVQRWLDDDMPSMMDVGGLVVGSAHCQAKLCCLSSGVWAGKPFFQAIFDALGCSVDWEDIATNEGVQMDVGRGEKLPLATVRGPVNMILRGERTALNAISRCSGVASASREAVDRARALHWKGWIAGTRKTTPGFRIVEKYGLIVGGAATHLLDLSQMVMLEDNHIWSAGSIANAVQLARQATGFSQKIEVECQTLEEALEAAAAGADIVMLGILDARQLKKDAATIKATFPYLLIEASGGITTETMSDYLCDHVDVVSQGNLTQGYSCVDYSLKIVQQKGNDIK